MLNDRKCGSELDTAARVGPLVIGRVFAVIMWTTVSLAPVVVPGNNAAFHGPVVAVGKLLAIVGKGVDGPDQRPEDGQNPSYARQTGFAQYHLQQ